MRREIQPFSLDPVPSPLGTLLVVHDDAGALRALDFPEYEARMHRLLRLHYGTNGYVLAPKPAPRALKSALDAFFAGEVDAIDSLVVRTGGTEFQRLVWVALRRIPAGTTTSYGQLAAAIERPDAVRAVGLANGANPVVIVVPCHRVIGADGSLTGYGGGLERKRWLLAHERACVGRRRASA
jgi:methylated-DNA-[protein]-cysteine S-methyltransferase